MRRFIISEDAAESIRKALQGNKEALYALDSGLCTLSPYMPCHSEIGDEECCGIFMSIDNDNSVVCNECGMSINDAVSKLYKEKEAYQQHFEVEVDDFVTVINSLKDAPDETFRVTRSKKLGALMLNDMVGTELHELYPEAIRGVIKPCSICHGEGSTTDHHDPCSNCGGKGYIE